MEVLLALVGLGFLAKANRKAKKKREERREMFRKIIRQLGMRDDDSYIDSIIKKKGKRKTPQQIYDEYQKKIDMATEDYTEARMQYTVLLKTKAKLNQELDELSGRKEKLDTLIKKYRNSDQHKETVYFYTKESMQLADYVAKKKQEVQGCEEATKEHKDQADKCNVELNALKIAQKEEVSNAKTRELLREAYETIMKRDKDMDKNFDVTEIMQSINESRVAFETTKVTYETDPYHQRKRMEREADRALAEEYANNLGGDSGFFYN